MIELVRSQLIGEDKYHGDMSKTRNHFLSTEI